MINAGNINKEVLINATVAGVLMAGTVIIKAVLKDGISINLNMNDVRVAASQCRLVEDLSVSELDI